MRSFERVLTPGTRGGNAEPLYPIAGARDFADGKARSIAGLSAPNDSTVVVRLSEPLAFFPKLLAMPVASIVPDATPANFGEHPVGTGPWKFVEWRHDDYLRFAKNERYWGGPPQVDSLVARIIPEPSTAVAEFESGFVDVLVVPEADTRNWVQTDEKKALLQTAPALILYYVGLNVNRGPLKDPRVRRALNHAVDTRTILEQLLGGRGRVAGGVIAPALDGADTSRAPYAHDVARAKQLLAEAGHPNGIDLELWHSQDATISRLAQAVQGYLAEAGIRAKLVQRDASSAREAARKGETDMILKTWYADYPDADSFLYPLLHTRAAGPGGNVSFYSNRVVDSLVVQARRTLDESARNALYREADRVAFEDAPMIYLFHYNELYAVQPWVRNFRVPTIFNGQRWLDVSIAGPGQQ